MHDAETGEVARETVFQVLEFYHVEIQDPDPCDPSCVLLIRGEIVWSKPIPEWCSRRLVQDFKRSFNMPVHHFYHPEMMSSQESND